MDISFINIISDFDVSSLMFLVGWSILNKSPHDKRIFFKRHGNESGQYKNIPAHSRVTLPDDKNYQFWDADSQIPIMPRRQVVINENGLIE